MTTDYQCTKCRRIRRFESSAKSVTAFCHCQPSKSVFKPVPWKKADWSMVNHVVAEAVGTTERIVAAKRKAFGHPRGTVGRRPKSVVWRKIEVKDVDFNIPIPRTPLAWGAQRNGFVNCARFTRNDAMSSPTASCDD